jgi:hypothetical protein
MSGSFKAVWLGDEDPQSQFVRMGDLAFVKGQTVTVPDKHEFADLIRENPVFAVDDNKAKPVEADEPNVDEQRDRAEEGTEKAALKEQLRGLGVSVQGNASVETLRAKLVEATK